ncbi:MAG TPA: hypothetical protein VG326_05920 [Tepidisphaeraceae bacterium]|nr:hypothetical protein [Tepidisphaeraceae bacterium]
MTTLLASGARLARVLAVSMIMTCDALSGGAPIFPVEWSLPEQAMS